MSDEKKGNKGQGPNKIQGPKGNSQLWVILVTVAVIMGVMWFSTASNIKELKNRGDLENMLRSGDVKKVALIKDQDYAEITLTEDALNNAKYNDVKEGPM